jgi:hypothetical protein
MSQYQTRDSVRESDEVVAELQWLEDGVNIIAAEGLRCAKTIVCGLFQILSGNAEER